MADHLPSQDLELDADVASRLLDDLFRVYRTASRQDDERAVSMARLAVAKNADDSKQARLLNSLTAALCNVYKRTESLATIDEAVSVAQQAVDATPADSPRRLYHLSNLAGTLSCRYKSSGAEVDLENAIEISRQVLENTTASDPARASRLKYAGTYLQLRYEKTEYDKPIRDLEEAISLGRQALEATPCDDPERPGRLFNLGIRLYLRFETTEAPADSEEAVSLLLQGIEAIPDGHPNRTCSLEGLRTMLSRGMEDGRALIDLDGAIRLTQNSIEATPPDHPRLATSLASLYNLLRRRMERDGPGAGDVDQVVGLARQAVAATPNNHPERRSRLTELASILAYRYETEGAAEVADINEAIDIARQVVEATSQRSADFALMLHSLGIFLVRRYIRLRVLSDLEEAINTARQAVRNISTGNSYYVLCLHGLVDGLLNLHERTGAHAALEEAISVARQVVEAAPSNHTGRANFFIGLGSALARRYEVTHTLADLDEAICLARQAVNGTPKGRSDRAKHLNTLGNCLGMRYERTRVWGDLMEAISTARQVVEATPDNHPDRGGYLSNLAVKLEHFQIETLAGLEEPVDIARQALDAIPKGDPERVFLTSNLAGALVQRYVNKGFRPDLEEAVCLARWVIEATPNDDHDRARCFLNLGLMLERLYRITRARHDLDEAIHCFRETWNMASSSPLNRITAAAAYLEYFPLDTCMCEAISIGKGALRLLPTVNTKLLSRNDQQHIIASFAGLAATLCSLLLATDQVEDALSSLEEGRAIILSDLLDTRSDASDVARTSPDLAGRLEHLRQEINEPLHEAGSAATREQQIRRRRDAVQDLETCILEIRTTPGNERFMMGLTTSDMRKCAEGGSIVVVNISIIRSDAIIITPQAVRAVQLTDLSVSDAQEWLGKEWNMRPSKFAESNREYRAYLAWLWTSCVEQILSEISTLKEAQEDAHPLRVWWIGSDLASSMPFHAAGIYHRDKESTETAYHRTISSYAPSIKTLAHARSRVNAPQTLNSLLVVTMPTTPAAEGEGEAGMYDLPGVTAEKNMLVDAAKEHITAKHMGGPSVEGVLEALPRCSIAHFACHGVSNAVDPSQSGLLLQRQGPVSPSDADSKLVQDNLSVGRVSELNLRNARLAYLSACSTAQNKANRLSDEVIHVVSGFQVAGFPHVVGCLWPSNDGICVLVAKRFYSQLLGKASPWRDDTVARAIRLAVMEVMADPRERGSPLRWAPFVHYGP